MKSWTHTAALSLNNTLTTILQLSILNSSDLRQRQCLRRIPTAKNSVADGSRERYIHRPPHEPVRIPVCAGAHWFLVKLTKENSAAEIYYSISQHWEKDQYERLISTLWDAIEIRDVAAKNITYHKC